MISPSAFDFLDLDEVQDLLDHPADRGSVLEDPTGTHLPKGEADHVQALVVAACNGAVLQSDFQATHATLLRPSDRRWAPVGRCSSQAPARCPFRSVQRTAPPTRAARARRR